MRRIPALLACAAIGLALAIADSTPSRATIASPTSSVVASGNGSTTTFAYGFIIPYQSNGTTPAVSAYLTNTTTSAVTPLVLGTDYSISGVGNSAGGTVTYPITGSPLAAGNTITIQRSLAYIQPTAVGNTAFYPHTVEQVADNLDMQIQQLNTTLAGFGGNFVTSFNTRNGAVVLSSADVSGAGGLLGANNLGDVGSASAAKTNLGLVAVASSGSASDLTSGTLAAARGGAGTITGALKANGSGVVSQAACADLSNGASGCSTAVGTIATHNTTEYAATANNLSDLASASAARTNLGVTASGSDTTYAYRANNLSDLGSASTARTNLGLGTVATRNTGTSGSVVPSLSSNNTWGSPQTFPQAVLSGSIAFAGGYISTQPLLYNNNTGVSGTDAVDLGLVPYNYINISRDSAVLSGGQNSTGVGLEVYANYGGGSMKGQRAAATFYEIQTGATANNGPVSTFFPTYAGITAQAVGTLNDNGTGVTSSTASGQITGANIIGQLNSTATDYYAVQGEELNVAMTAGTSAYQKIGLEVVQFTTDAVQGSGVDAGIWLVDQPGGTAPGWKNGVLIDSSALSATSNAFHSPGFNVDNVGRITVLTGTLSGASNALLLKEDDGTNGAQIQMTNTAGGVTNPNKFWRISNSGHLQLINSAYTTAIMDINDSGSQINTGFYRPGITTVGNLATVDPSPQAGDMLAVSDAVACTANATPSGSGSTTCPLVYSGGAWKAQVTH